MNLTSKRIIKKLLKKYQIRPAKRLGQNFLIDKLAIKKFLEITYLQSKDIVLEIGPGMGTLTQKIAQKAKKVIAVEKDPKMIEILKKTLREFKNLKIIQGDILKINPKTYNLKSKTYKIVANLPYYLTAPVIRKFLESENQPKEMILMVQKEVAQRICTKPPRMNLLAVSVQFYAKPKIISFVPKKSFWPSPKVNSAIMKLKVKNQKLKVNRNLFFKIVRAGFSQPRKQILNNLSKVLKLDKEKIKAWLFKNNIRPNQRAETLGLEDWIKLTKTFKPQ